MPKFELQDNVEGWQSLNSMGKMYKSAIVWTTQGKWTGLNVRVSEIQKGKRVWCQSLNYKAMEEVARVWTQWARWVNAKV